MYYGYDICPKCKDRLMERCQENEKFERYSGEKCDKCGSKLRLALIGEKRVDETIYEITVSPWHINNKNKCVQAIMELYNCEYSVAEKKMETKETVLFKGDILHVYLTMEWLCELYGIDDFDVSPEFPFLRIAYIDCPDCGGDTCYKIAESEKEGYMLTGYFCENCNSWVANNYTPKINLDETKYKVTFSLQEIDREEDEKIKEQVEEVKELISRCSERKIRQNEIMIRACADEIHMILQDLEALHVDYNIEPRYPYPVIPVSEEDLKEILQLNGIEIN